MPRRLTFFQPFSVFVMVALVQGCFVASPQKRENDILKQEQAKIRSSIAEEKRLQTQRTPDQAALHRGAAIEQTIAQYESFVSMPGPMTEAKLNAMRRLGDLYMDAENDRFSAALQAYEKTIETSSAQLPPPVKNFSKSIVLYEKVLKISPRYANRDQIFYNLASCFDQMGEREKSVIWLKKLTSEFSSSEYSQEVYFRLGEFYFDRNNLPEALAYYQKGAAFKASPLYYANTLYKAGWTHYLLENFAAAVDSFREILDFNLAQGGKFTPLSLDKPQAKASEPLRKDLVGDTLQMISRSFTEMNQAVSVSEYFKKVGDRPYLPEIYFGMAAYIAQQDRFPEALKILDLFLNLYPRHERVLDVYESIIHIYVETKNFEKASQTREKLVAFLAPDQAWFASNTDVAVRKRAQEFRLLSLEELALYNNHQAQQVKSNPQESARYFRQAVKWYQVFLQEADAIQFKNLKKLEDTRYLFAECLFESNQFASAGEVYLRVSQRHPDIVKRMKAGNDAFIAVEKDFYEKLERKEKTESTLKMLTLSRQNYQRLLADGKIDKSTADGLKLASFLEREGNAYFKVDQISAARAPLEELIEEYPATPEAFRATKVLALGYFKQQQYQKAEMFFSSALQLLSKQSEISSREEQDLRELRAGSLFKMAEELQKKGDAEKAALAFLKVQTTEPKSALVDKSLYQASQQYLKMRNLDQAFSVSRKLAKEFPKSELAFAGIWECGQSFKSSKQWSFAGVAFSEASYLARKPSERQAAMVEAALAYEEALQFEKEIPIWQALLGQQPLPSAVQRIEYAYRLASAFEKVKQEQMAKRYFLETKNLYDQLQFDVQKKRAKDSDLQSVGFFVAKAYLALGQREEEKLLGIRLVPPFEKNLKAKQHLLDSTLKYYAKVIEFKDAEMVTEVGFRIGWVLEDFAKNLKESPAPENLSKEERQQYVYLLEEKAFPFEEKAIAAYEGNLTRARENSLFNAWVKKSYDHLSTLVPARYAKNEKMPALLPVQELY